MPQKKETPKKEETPQQNKVLKVFQNTETPQKTEMPQNNGNASKIFGNSSTFSSFEGFPKIKWKFLKTGF